MCCVLGISLEADSSLIKKLSPGSSNDFYVVIVWQMAERLFLHINLFLIVKNE